MLKRLILALAATATIAAPMLAATTANAQDRGRYDHRYDNRDSRHDDRGRDDRRWDASRHNGYYLGNRWYYGAPPVAYYSRYDYRPGFRAWERGGYVPRGYPVTVIYDYGRYRLRPPPRGYRWEYVDGQYVLAAIATGLIIDLLASR